MINISLAKFIKVKVDSFAIIHLVASIYNFGNASLGVVSRIVFTQLIKVMLSTAS